MGCCSDSDDDEELLFGPVCTTLGDSSNDALNAPECPEFGENAHKEKSVLRFEEEKRKAIRWRKDFEKKQRLDRESLLDANASSSSSTDSENEETIQGFPPSRIIIHGEEEEEDHGVKHHSAKKSLLRTLESPSPCRRKKRKMDYSDMGSTLTREGITFMEMLENSKPKVEELVWVKYKGAFWPARIIPKSAEWAMSGCQDLQMKDDEILVRFFPVTDKQRYKHGISSCGVKTFAAWNAIMGWSQKYLDKALLIEVEEKRGNFSHDEKNLETEADCFEKTEEEKEGGGTAMEALAEMGKSRDGEECSSSAATFGGKVNDVARLSWPSKRLEGLELRAGYWIFYYHPAFGCTDDGKREAQIIEVRNLQKLSDENINGISSLELTSNDTLPGDHPIMRLAVPPSLDDARKISMHHQGGDAKRFDSCNTLDNSSPPVVLEGERMRRLNEFILMPSRVDGLCTEHDEVIQGIREVQHHIMKNMKEGKEGTGGDISHFMVNFKSRRHSRDRPQAK